MRDLSLRRSADPSQIAVIKQWLTKYAKFDRAMRGKCVRDEGHHNRSQVVHQAWTDDEMEIALRGEGDPLGLILGKTTRLCMVVFTVDRKLRIRGRKAFINDRPAPWAQRALQRLNEASRMAAGFSFQTDGGYTAAYMLDDDVATTDLNQFMSDRIIEARLPPNIIRASVSGTSSAPFFVPAASAIRSEALNIPDDCGWQPKENPARLIPPKKGISTGGHKPGNSTAPISDPHFLAVRSAFISYFSGARQASAGKFFDLLHAYSVRWMNVSNKGRFPLMTFPLPSRLMASWNRDYREFMDVLIDLKVIETVTGYSSGRGCYTATSTRYSMSRVPVQPFNRVTVFAKLNNTTLTLMSIAEKVGVNERTIRRWVSRPGAVAPEKVIKLMRALG